MINPIKNYIAPRLPTLEAAQKDPDLLKKLPSRWQKNLSKTAAAFCVGAVGMAMLTGAAHGGMVFSARNNVAVGVQSRTTQNPAELRAHLETTNLNIRTHWGGSGYGPFYVAYFTEQEAFGFIRAKLEQAGLTFVDHPPSITAVAHGWLSGGGLSPLEMEFGVELFDENKNIGIVNMRNMQPWHYISVADVTAAFNALEKDMTFRVFYNRGENVGQGSPDFSFMQHIPVTEETRENARLRLITNLERQVEQFVLYLQNLKILPREGAVGSGEIKVEIDGKPLEFEVAPQNVNGRILVPMRAIFEALGFEVEWHEETQTIIAQKYPHAHILRMQVNNNIMYIGEATMRPVVLDVTPQIVNGRTLVPIRAIAEATGATVEWDEKTQTVKIEI